MKIFRDMLSQYFINSGSFAETILWLKDYGKVVRKEFISEYFEKCSSKSKLFTETLSLDANIQMVSEVLDEVEKKVLILMLVTGDVKVETCG